MQFRRISAATLFALSMFGMSCADETVNDSPDGENDVAFADGKADSLFGECEAERALTIINDAGTTVDSLKEAGVHTRAAKNIIKTRNGADEAAGTEDDYVFADLYEVDKVKYVGKVAMQQIATMVVELCVVQASPAEVIFSPQPYEQSHLKRVADLIDDAQSSIDIAMYSYRDGGIGQALERAVDRGVSVRMIFEKANSDKRSPAGTASSRIEDMGIDVRYVNKIMHHKFVLIDGPRSLTAQDSATDAGVLSSGSANWSSSAGTRYDENTVFVFGNTELNMRFQKEFNHLWANSRDFSWNTSLTYFESDSIPDESIPDDPSVHAVFTSANFKTSVSSRYGNTFSVIRGENEVADMIVEQIQNAESSILVATGHLRSRPISEAIMQKKADNPNIEIRVYLDAQEYISEATHGYQIDKLANCLVAAGTSQAKTQNCYDKGFYFSYPFVESGIDVKFKYYSYRWHYSYAEQMHHKYLIIDGETLITGSYNLSDNAEHNTMENVMIFDGAGFPDLVDAYIANFESMWTTADDENLYAGLMEEVQNGTETRVPIVFDSMALTWAQVRDLKSALYAACSDINSSDFRRNPENHYSCTRR